MKYYQTIRYLFGTNNATERSHNTITSLDRYSVMNRFTALTLIYLQQSTWGFAPPHKAQNPSPYFSRLSYGSSPEPEYYTNDVPPFSKHESESSRKQRMEMVRQLRKALVSEKVDTDVKVMFVLFLI